MWSNHSQYRKRCQSFPVACYIYCLCLSPLHCVCSSCASVKVKCSSLLSIYPSLLLVRVLVINRDSSGGIPHGNIGTQHPLLLLLSHDLWECWTNCRCMDDDRLPRMLWCRSLHSSSYESRVAREEWSDFDWIVPVWQQHTQTDPIAHTLTKTFCLLSQ